jgi:hypothetical protein
MRGPGPEFQRDTIYWGIQAHLILEGQLRLRLMGEIGRYADMSENALDEDKGTIREQLEVIEDTINALCEVSRACGALIGQAT